MASVRALTFDVFGTVVDWRAGVVAAGRELTERTGVRTDWESFADDWRRGYEPAMEEVRVGRRPWATIDVLHREILERLLAERNLELSDEQVASLNDAWHRLPAWPDVVAALNRLRPHYVVAALSNGNVSLLVDLARHNGFAWDCVLSAQNARQYKPLPVVYETAADLLGLPANEIMMVAAHDHDLNGARAAGFRTAFVSRSDEWGQNAGAEVPTASHDANVSGLSQLADELLAAG